MTDWIDGAAFDIFIADGGVDDYELLTDQELEKIIREALPHYVPMILKATRDLKTWV